MAVNKIYTIIVAGLVTSIAGGTYLYLINDSSNSSLHNSGSSLGNNITLESDINQLSLIQICMTRSYNYLNSAMLNNSHFASMLNPKSNQVLISYLENQNKLAYNLSKTAYYVSNLANSTLQAIYKSNLTGNNSQFVSQMSFNVSSINNIYTEVYIHYQVVMDYESYLVKLSTVPYKIYFTENGLPQGSNWSISINGFTKYSKNNSIIFHELFGQYAYFANSTSPTLFKNIDGNVSVSDNLTKVVNFSIINQSVANVVLHISYPKNLGGLIAYDGAQTDNLTLPGFTFTPGHYYNYTFNLMDQSSDLYIYNLSVQGQNYFKIISTLPKLPWQVEYNGALGSPFSFTVALNTTLSPFQGTLNFYINANIYPGYS